jgi:hypothetical protein
MKGFRGHKPRLEKGASAVKTGTFQRKVFEENKKKDCLKGHKLTFFNKELLCLIIACK